MAAKASKQAPGFSAFISHAKADAKKAQAIAEGLEKRGFKCWIAPRDVRPGHTYSGEIIRGIESARNFVLVLSKASNDSGFVVREVERAISKKKPVFTVRIENVMPGPYLELFVASTQWIDAFPGRLAPHIDRLAKLLAEEEGHAPDKTAPDAGSSRRLPRWAIPAGAAALVLLVLGAVVSLRSAGDPNLAQRSDPDYQACETGTGTSAIAACDRAIYSGKFSGPNLAYLYNDRGFLHMMNGDLGRGQADFGRAIQLDPDNYYPYWNRAEILRRRGEIDDARADYQKALTFNPKENDKLIIEASSGALAAKSESDDPTVITVPSWGNEGERAVSVPALSFPPAAATMPASPPMATTTIPASPAPMPAVPPPMPVR